MSNGTSQEKNIIIILDILDRSDICKIKPDDKGNFSQKDQEEIDQFENRVDDFIEKIESKVQDKEIGKLISWESGDSTTQKIKRTYGIIFAKDKVFYSEENFWYIIDCSCIKDKKVKKFKSSPYFNRNEVIARLRHALYCFYQKPYHKNKWNGEHLARLVVENDAKNYDQNNSYLGLFEATEAEQEFTQYLNIHSPKLNPDIFNHFVHSSFGKNIWNLLNKNRWKLIILLVFTLIGLLLFSFLESLLSNPSLIWLGIIIIVILIIVLVNAIFVQLYDWKKAGFADKNLWNWLELLLVPTFLAIGSFYIQSRLEQKQQIRIEREEQQESLKSYFSQVKDIVSENSVAISIDKLAQKLEPTQKSKDSEKTNESRIIKLSEQDQKLLTSLTLVMMNDMNDDGKSQILELLSSLNLIKITDIDGINVDIQKLQKCQDEYTEELYPSVQIPLNTVNVKLNKIRNKNVNLMCASLRGIDLSKTKFDEADLRYVDFRQKTDLKNVNFDSKTIKILGARFGTTTKNLSSVKFPQEMIINLDEQNKSIDEQNKKIQNELDNYLDFQKEEKKTTMSPSKRLELENWLIVFNIILEHHKPSKINTNCEKSHFYQALIDKLQERDEKKLPKYKQKLAGTELNNIQFCQLKFGEKMNFNRANLSEANLAESEAIFAFLIDSKLTNTNIENASFVNSVFIKANLTAANLSNANLMGTNLTIANLTDANLTGANLTGANLTDADLTGANLTDANLTDANLSNINLTDANLSNINLTNTNLSNVNLMNTNLSNVDLTNTNLSNFDLFFTNLTGADLTGADLTGADLTGADLTGADLTGADLTQAILIQANLSQAKNMDKVSSWENACYNEFTIFPDSFDDEKKKELKLEKIEPGKICKVHKEKDDDNGN